MSIHSAVNRLAVRSQVRMLAGIRRFGRRSEGVAAVEFALIVPIMAMMFIGAVEMSQAVTVDRRVSQVASSTGDLVARIDQDIAQTEVHDIAKIGSYLMSPFAPASLKIDISMITSNSTSATVTTERWRCAYDGSNPSNLNCTCPKTSYTIPTGLIDKLDGVVVAEVTYSYKPVVFDVFMKQAAPGAGGTYPIKEKLYLKPRAVCPKLNKSDNTVCTCFD